MVLALGEAFLAQAVFSTLHHVTLVAHVSLLWVSPTCSQPAGTLHPALTGTLRFSGCTSGSALAWALLLLAALPGLLALGCSLLLGSTEAGWIASMSFRSLLHPSGGGSGRSTSWGPLIAHTYPSIPSICTTTPIRVWASMSVV